jgi:hypothetical protein
MAFPLVCSCENAYKKEEFMSLIINFSRNWLLLLVLLSSVSYADFEINHCYDCGNVLVGAAFFQPNVIKWETNGSSAAIILQASGTFGFSGDSTYLSEKAPNKWRYKSTYYLVIDAGYYSSPPMGHYFAPDKEGDLESPNRYTALLDSPNDVVREVTVWGKGIADDKNEPAITLDVSLDQESVGCAYGTAQCKEVEVLDEDDEKMNIQTEPAKLGKCIQCQETDQCQEIDQCQEVEVLENRHLVFTITPKLERDPAGVQPVSHVFIDLIFDDTNTECQSQQPPSWPLPDNYTQQSFRTKNITPNNFDDISQYYHYMGTRGPWFTNPACRFSVPFLVSVNKPFQIQTKNLRLIEKDGYANITFAVRGHYDREHPEFWPGSQPTFRLKTQGKLTVNVNGEGEISSEPAGIDGCTSECTAQFPSGEVQLIPDPNTDVIWGENCPEGKVTVVAGQDTSCTVEFGSLGGGWKFRPALGERIESNAEFYGTILVNDQRLANGGVLAGGAEVDIVATVEHEPEPVNQWAHQLLLLKYRSLDEIQWNDTLWIKTDQEPVFPAFPWTLWDVFDNNFDFFNNIPDNPVIQKLSNQFKINIFNGIFPPELTGTYEVWVGYRLINTGEIVYSPESISFTVLESSTTD